MNQITLQQIITMLKLQDEMNVIVNPKWSTAGYAWMRAVLVEICEGIEHFGYKWWKKQTPDMPQLHMEIVDVWHFIISSLLEKYGASNSIESLAEYVMTRVNDKPVDVYYNLKTYKADQSILEDLDLMAHMASTGEYSLRLFSNILAKTGLTWGWFV